MKKSPDVADEVRDAEMGPPKVSAMVPHSGHGSFSTSDILLRLALACWFALRAAVSRARKGSEPEV